MINIWKAGSRDHFAFNIKLFAVFEVWNLIRINCLASQAACGRGLFEVEIATILKYHRDNDSSHALDSLESLAMKAYPIVINNRIFMVHLIKLCSVVLSK